MTAEPAEAVIDLPMPIVDRGEHHFATIDGLRVHWAEAGEGQPLVLLHGWPQHWYAGRAVIPRLSEDYRVICPDFRGLGWSEGPRRGYSLRRLAADVVALLAHLGLERVRL